jgi:hypothetical protein
MAASNLFPTRIAIVYPKSGLWLNRTLGWHCVSILIFCRILAVKRGTTATSLQQFDTNVKGIKGDAFETKLA